MDIRVGSGFDAHAFAPAACPRPMMLALLEWPGVQGLEGHSDADVVAHALCDALLSAAGLGDLGSNYGVDRPEFAGASGRMFLEDVMSKIRRENWQVINASVQVIGNKPRMSGRTGECEAALSAVVSAPVSLSATTTDGMGFLGRGEGVAAIATVLIGKTN